MNKGIEIDEKKYEMQWVYRCLETFTRDIGEICEVQPFLSFCKQGLECKLGLKGKLANYGTCVKNN